MNAIVTKVSDPEKGVSVVLTLGVSIKPVRDEQLASFGRPESGADPAGSVGRVYTFQALPGVDRFRPILDLFLLGFQVSVLQHFALNQEPRPPWRETAWHGCC